MNTLKDLDLSADEGRQRLMTVLVRNPWTLSMLHWDAVQREACSQVCTDPRIGRIVTDYGTEFCCRFDRERVLSAFETAPTEQDWSYFQAHLEDHLAVCPRCVAEALVEYHVNLVIDHQREEKALPTHIR